MATPTRWGDPLSKFRNPHTNYSVPYIPPRKSTRLLLRLRVNRPIPKDTDKSYFPYINKTTAVLELRSERGKTLTLHAHSTIIVNNQLTRSELSTIP